MVEGTLNGSATVVRRHVDAMLQDLRFGVRQARRNPGLSAVIVGSLAMGIGATSALFSLTNALLFKPLPVPRAKELVTLVHGRGNALGPSLPYPDFLQLQKAASQINLFAMSGTPSRLRTDEQDQQIHLAVVSGNFFSALQVTPQAGRFFQAENDRRGGNYRNTVVISDRLWRSAFQTNPRIIGSTVHLDGIAFVVIGVTPGVFFGVSPGSYVDATITFAGSELLHPESPLLDCRQCNAAQVMGRLANGASLRRVQSSLQAHWSNIKRLTNSEGKAPETAAADMLWLTPGFGGSDSHLRSSFTKPLAILLGMSALILLMCCSNIANLLLARATARKRELAVRLSTGASRSRILRQFLTEAFLFALLGTAAGWLTYGICVRGLLLFMSSNGTDVWLDTSPDTRMIAFAIGTTTATTLVCGLLPAFRASRTPRLVGGMAENSPNSSAKATSAKLILVTQLAFSFVLMTGALLLARSLYDLRNVDAGFRQDHLVIATPKLTRQARTPDEQRRLVATVVARLSALPGVRAASASANLPIAGSLMYSDYVKAGESRQSDSTTHCFVNYVTPGFFKTMGTSLLAGRDFRERDQTSTPEPVAIVSESFARMSWGDDNPIGKQIQQPGKAPKISIVGVVRDARQFSLRDTNERTVYLAFPTPLIDGLSWGFTFEVWTALSPETLMSTIRRTIAGETQNASLEIQSFQSAIDRRLIYERLLSALAISFASLGLLMATLGVYGVATYATIRRTSEVGVRIALGAGGRQILDLFMREQLLMIAAGLAVGGAAALALSQFIKSWLFGVAYNDPLTYLSVAALLAALTLLSSLAPAIRLLRKDPWRSLRAE